MYSRLPHGRLVILGGAGAGKSGALLLLLLEALERRADIVDDVVRAREPVPVLLTLGAWDPQRETLRD